MLLTLSEEEEEEKDTRRTREKKKLYEHPTRPFFASAASDWQRRRIDASRHGLPREDVRGRPIAMREATGEPFLAQKGVLQVARRAAVLELAVATVGARVCTASTKPTRVHWNVGRAATRVDNVPTRVHHDGNSAHERDGHKLCSEWLGLKIGHVAARVFVNGTDITPAAYCHPPRARHLQHAAHAHQGRSPVRPHVIRRHCLLSELYVDADLEKKSARTTHKSIKGDTNRRRRHVLMSRRECV